MTNTANTQPTATAIAGTWKVTGRGKSAAYYAAVPAKTKPAAGALVALTAKSGAITYGRLTAPADLNAKDAAGIAAGIAVWQFERAADLMTPELRAENAALKSDARAAFLRSDAGIAQAARIAARAERMAGLPDTGRVTVSIDPSIVKPAAAPAAPAPQPTAQPADTQPAGMTVAETMANLRAAGFTAAEVLAAIAGAADTQPTAQPTAPAAPKPRAPRKPAAAKPAAGAKPAAPISLASLNAAAGKRTVK